MANPFDQFDAAPRPMIPGTGPKPQPGYISTGLGSASFVQGGGEDPNTIRAQTAAREGTAAAIQTQAAIQRARAEAAVTLQRDAQAREAERQFTLQKTPQQRQISKLGNDEILSALGKARGDVQAGWSTGRFPMLPQMLQPENTRDLAGSLNTIASRLTLDKLAELKANSPTGASGLGSLTEKEGALLRDSVAGLAQTQSEARLLENLAAVERHYRRYQALVNGENPDDQAVAQSYGLIPADDKGAVGVQGAPGAPGGPNGGGPSTPQPGIPGAQEFLAPTKGAMRTEADPALAGVNNRIRAMVAAGANPDMIREYMDQVSPGLGARMADDVNAAVQYRAQHPETPMSQYTVSVENRSVPMSAARQMLNKAAQSPLGAFGVAAGDAATLGTLDNMTSNPALTRAGMQSIREQNPGSSLAGTVFGGAAAGGLAEAGLGMAGLGKLAPMAADALYGAAYGAGSNDDDRLAGALYGSAGGLGGGVLARGATRVAGRAVAGVADPALRYLRDARIPMTVGQVVGGAAKSAEDRLAGLPFVGDMINARRRSGFQAMQRAAFDEALQPIGQAATGQIGEAGVQGGLDSVSDAYKRALGGASVQIDPAYAQAMGLVPGGKGSVVNAINAIPRPGLPNEVGTAINATVSPMFQGGRLTGDGFQAIDRSLEQLKGGYKNDPLYATHIRPAIDGAGDAVEGLFSRQSPETLAAYNQAKQAYRNMSVLGDAVNAGVNEGGEFTAAQLGRAARSNTIRFSGKNAAASGRRPFYELQRAAQSVLPSKIPDSGTAGRLAIPALASALGGSLGAGASPEGERGSGALTGALALGSLAALPYSKPAQAAITKSLLADRPDAFVKFGEMAIDKARLAGMFGRPAAIGYYGTGGY